MNTCKHLSRAGDNYGESCLDCGAQLRGYGYGGWFGSQLDMSARCIHQWLPVGDMEEVCCYCEAWREKQPEEK